MLKIFEYAELNDLMILKRQLEYVLFKKQLHIKKLPNDILVRHIYLKLSRKDRLSFAQALTWEKRRLLQYYDLFHFYVTDTMVLQLRSCINMIADVALYSCSCSLIFADWSGFGCLRQTPLAKIYWSGFAPHMRVEIDEDTLQKCIGKKSLLVVYRFIASSSSCTMLYESVARIDFFNASAAKEVTTRCLLSSCRDKLHLPHQPAYILKINNVVRAALFVDNDTHKNASRMIYDPFLIAVDGFHVFRKLVQNEQRNMYFTSMPFIEKVDFLYMP